MPIDKDDVIHQGKTITQWEKDFKGEFTYNQLLKMAKSGCDLQKILMLGLDEAENSKVKDIDDKELFKGEEFFFNESNESSDPIVEFALYDENGKLIHKNAIDPNEMTSVSLEYLSNCVDDYNDVAKAFPNSIHQTAIIFVDGKPLSNISSVRKAQLRRLIDNMQLNEKDIVNEDNNDVVVTTKDFISQMKRNLANDSDKIMFRVDKKPYEVFDMHGKGGTFIVDLIPQVVNTLNEDIIEDPDIDTAADLIDIINDATNGRINSSVVKIEDNTGREYNITSISGYRGDLHIGIAMKNAIRESKQMYRNYRDKIISFIENGLLTWEEVGRECLQRMSTNEIENMMQDCDWDDNNSSLDENKQIVNEEAINGEYLNVSDLRRIGMNAYPKNKNAWMTENIVGIVDGKVSDFTEVEHIRPEYPSEGTFFLLDGTEASRQAFEKEKSIMLNEGRNWRTGGYGGYGRSYQSYGELGAPRGKAISWFNVEELDPKARGKMKDWRVGPSNFPFKDLLYPERKYKVGTTVLRSKFLKAGEESGVKYIAVPSYLEAIWNNDEAAIELLKALGIPLDLTFGYNKGEDFTTTYTT